MCVHVAAALNNGLYDNLKPFREAVENGHALCPQTTNDALKASSVQVILNVVKKKVAEGEKRQITANETK